MVALLLFTFRAYAPEAGGLGAKLQANGGKEVLGQSAQQFSRYFNKNKVFLGLNFCFITILWQEQAEGEVELFRFKDHDKLHNPFQSFISVAVRLENEIDNSVAYSS